MQATGRIFIAAVLSIFIITLAVESEAGRANYRGRGHLSRPGHFKSGHKRSLDRGHKRSFHRGHKRSFHRGHYKRSPKHRYRHGYYGYGAKHRYGHKRSLYGRKHYNPRLYYRHGYKHGFTLHLGHGLYGRYGYGKYHPFRYPYGYGYPYKGYKTNRYYDDYSGSYPGDSFDTYSGVPFNQEEAYVRGWNLLREDRPDQALQAFGQLAQANPSKGMPKIGYALALAELGRLDKSIWAMRRALKTDPEALPYVAVDEELRSKVERAAERYERSDQFSGNVPGGSFMLAALYYLLDDMDAAQNAMERNTNSYDTSTSAENLKRLIEGEIQAQ